ncbi:dihydrolipoamide acetyltransferase family protein [Nakamurella lactea]|uniref:dihydrolipoamide acetyltransferase family protein n=1 Tax=Nakamurella lactea TaxID=459515 RepID=UPI0003FDA35C|nr:dihydrolipoamide acetyltransferase family protein [Nakamurella lactea]
MAQHTASNAPATGRIRQFPLPDVGEGLTEAEILEWKVAVGDTVTVNQILVEIETAKAAVELPSPWAGQVHELLAEPGVTINVGTPIISIDTEPGAGPAADVEEVGSKIGEVAADGRIATLVGYIPAAGSSARRPRKGLPGQPPAPTAAAQLAAGGEPGTAADAVKAGATHGEPGHSLASAGGPTVDTDDGAPRTQAPLAAPPVRKYAKDLGVDLASVSSSRDDGVITRADVAAAADSPAAGDSAPVETVAVQGGGARQGGGERRVPIKGVRKMTAQAMVSSAFTAPHVTEFLTVDVTPMMQLRERLKARRDFAGVKITPLTFAARAVCIAARRTPEVNSVWDEAAGEIVFKDYVHLGIAAATPRGLVVPNIRDADRMSMLELAAALGELTDIARQGKTSPAAMAGGTFTITNVGVFGVDTGTPIINPGESAILALGSIKDLPWVVDGQIAVRKVCQLALSFDHRVIDGQQGSEFLADVGALLADPGMAMVF